MKGSKRIMTIQGCVYAQVVAEDIIKMIMEYTGLDYKNDYILELVIERCRGIIQACESGYY